MASTGVASVLAPPRVTGDAAADAQALSLWQFDIAKILASQQETIADLSGDSGTVDPNDLPDPASTNLATAQQTANDAYILASSAKQQAEDVEASLAQRFPAAGTITISDVATTGAYTLPTAQADTAYFVAVTPTAKSGAAAAGSNVIESIAKTTTTITITINAAPGVGTSRTFDVVVFRAPS
jgi:hypothetical protein